MVEVLIAGILLASALAAVSRMSVAALTGSAGLSYRTRIEAAINDNIQLMQQLDSYYTDEFILENEGQEALQDACADPALALSNYLQSLAPEAPELRDSSITRTFDVGSIPRILRIIYSFEGPESQVGLEQRMIEMTPNFAAKCYTTR